MHKCAHGACHCEIADDRRFCSDECEERFEESWAPGAFGMDACACNHEQCLAKVRAELLEQEGRD